MVLFEKILMWILFLSAFSSLLSCFFGVITTKTLKQIHEEIKIWMILSLGTFAISGILSTIYVLLVILCIAQK